MATTFTFPSRVKKGAKFNCVEDFLSSIRSEAESRGLPGAGDLYQALPETSKNPNSVRFRCRICSKSFALKRIKHGLIANSRLAPKHTHPTQKRLQDDRTECVQERLRTRTTVQLSPFSYKKPNREAMSHTPPPTSRLKPGPALKIEESPIIQRALEEHPFDTLEEWFIAHNYVYKIIEPEKKSLVFVSSTMLSNYQQYSDIVSFDIVYDLIRPTTYGSYQMGIWSVCDSSNRIQIVGVVLFLNETAKHLQAIFREFFVLHGGRYPGSLMTSDKRQILESVRCLKKKEKFGTIINPWYVIREFTSKLNGSSLEIREVMVKTMNMMQARAPEVFDSLMEELVVNPISSRPIKSLLNTHPSVFYCTTDQYVGLSRSNTQQLVDELKFRRENITKVVCEIHALDQRFNNRLRERYNCEFDVQFLDPRLVELREHCDRDIVARYLENYLQALKDHTTQGYDSSIYIVQSSVDKLTVTNWSCECLELTRTGIPCPHLISAALVDGRRSYLSLVSPRWVHAQRL